MEVYRVKEHLLFDGLLLIKNLQFLSNYIVDWKLKVLKPTRLFLINWLLS